MAQPMVLLVHLMSMDVHLQPFAVDASAVAAAVAVAVASCVVAMIVGFVELLLAESFDQRKIKILTIIKMQFFDMSNSYHGLWLTNRHWSKLW